MPFNIVPAFNIADNDAFDKTKPRPPEANKALVMFAHGHGFALAYEVNDALQEFITDAGGHPETFDLEKIGAHYDAPPTDGLYVYELHVVDDGPGDWPGAREVAVGLKNGRLATAEEWQAFCREEYPW